MKYFFLLFVGVIISSSVLMAGGGTTYDFLRTDVSARAAALGGSFVTMTDDPNVIFYNPSGLSSIGGSRVSFGYFKHLLDINSGYASFATEVTGLGYVGAGIVYINYGDFKRTGESGQDLGTFGAGDLALIAGYGGELETGLHYGVNAKFIYSSIAEVHSTGVALDFGLQYIAIQDRMLIGLSLMNLGTQLDPYVNTKESLPLDFKIGASIYPEHLPVIILLNIHRLNEKQENFTDRFKAFTVGFELKATPNFTLRVGYDNARRKDAKISSSSGLAGFSAGGGISTDIYDFDYAFNSYGSIGSLHRVSVAVSF